MNSDLVNEFNLRIFKLFTPLLPIFKGLCIGVADFIGLPYSPKLCKELNHIEEYKMRLLLYCHCGVAGIISNSISLVHFSPRKILEYLQNAKAERKKVIGNTWNFLDSRCNPSL